MSRAGEVEARPPAEIIIIVSLDIYTQMIVIFTCSQVNIETEMGSVVKIIVIMVNSMMIIIIMMLMLMTCSQVNIDTDMGSVVKRGMKPSIPYTQL